MTMAVDWDVKHQTKQTKHCSYAEICLVICISIYMQQTTSPDSISDSFFRIIELLLTVKAVNLIFISERGSAI